jgi:FkbM family methyltransferase
MLLLARGHRVAAFEPSLESSAHLWRSAEAAGHLSRLALFPEALGARDARLRLITQETNAGNAQVVDVGDTAVADPGHVLREETTVHTRTLDDLLRGARRNEVIVAKMDVQGYEARVLAGGESVLRRGVVGALLFECEDVRLRAHGSGPMRLHRQLEDLGFGVLTTRGEKVGKARMRQLCGDRVRQAFGSVNLVGVHTSIHTPSVVARCLWRHGMRHGCFGPRRNQTERGERVEW